MSRLTAVMKQFGITPPKLPEPPTVRETIDRMLSEAASSTPAMDDKKSMDDAVYDVAPCARLLQRGMEP